MCITINKTFFKESIIIIVFLFSCNITRSQNIILKDTIIHDGAGAGIVKLNDESLIITSYKFTSGNTSELYLTKIDPLGNVVWDKSYNINRRNYPNSITIDSENNIYVLVECENWSLWCYKFDSNGKTLWSKRITDYDTRRVNNNIYYDNISNVLFLISREANVIRLNLDGEIISTTSLGAKNAFLHSISITNKGDFIGVGDYYKNGLKNRDVSNIYVVKFNSDGILQKDNILDLGWGREIKKVKNNYIILGKSEFDVSNKSHNKFLAILNQDLELITKTKVKQNNYGNDFDDIVVDREKVIVSTFTENRDLDLNSTLSQLSC